MKKYMNLFLNDEDGVETIEFIALVAVAAVLIGYRAENEGHSSGSQRKNRKFP